MTTPESRLLDRGLLSDQIHAYVKSQIQDATLVPGQQIVESQLAKTLGVSQAPVREALKRLVHESLVTHVPHQGNFVTTFSPEDARQAQLVRTAIERLAATLCCGRPYEGLRASLSSIVDQMHSAADERDVARFRELDFAFHRCVIEASGNAYLPRMWDLLEPSLRSLHVVANPLFSGDWHAAADMHRGLLDALEGEDPEAAGEAFAQHGYAPGRTGTAPDED